MYHMCKINSIIVFRKTQSIQSDWARFVYTAQPFSYIFLHLKNNHHRHQNLKIVTCFINHTNKVLRSVFFKVKECWGGDILKTDGGMCLWQLEAQRKGQKRQMYKAAVGAKDWRGSNRKDCERKYTLYIVISVFFSPYKMSQSLKWLAIVYFLA